MTTYFSFYTFVRGFVAGMRRDLISAASRALRQISLKKARRNFVRPAICRNFAQNNNHHHVKRLS